MLAECAFLFFNFTLRSEKGPTRVGVVCVGLFSLQRVRIDLSKCNEMVKSYRIRILMGFVPRLLFVPGLNSKCLSCLLNT